MADPARPLNRLASEASLYLRQHASNPVDWYPWGPEALARARELDRPILLSVGYSACHWCHVMERECFENPSIAALMNAGFVCIKVDREERPDIDHLYMKALQGMTGRGGWPMTVFLTPDGLPFHAGTYFPPEDRGSMPGLPRVLAGVARVWAERRDDVIDSGQRMVEYLSRAPATEGAEAFSVETFVAVADSLVSSMDAECGGFGRAPKFPGTMALGLLLDAEAWAPDPSRRALLRLSLDRMAAGGIRDHLGGGFHRYSVDREWLVPHFEKMLYDQALMASLYADASRFFGDPSYAEVAVSTLEYVLAEMTAPDGTFYSAQDADSEGEEGRFFVWTAEEIAAIVGEPGAALFLEAYGVTEGGNFEGRNVLHRAVSSRAIAAARGLREDEVDAVLASCRAKLLVARSQRPAPATDRKVAVDWNSLLVAALVATARAADRDDLLDAAERAAGRIREAMDERGGVPHILGGAAVVPGFLDDHAFFGAACLDLFAARPRREHFDAAVACAWRLLADFRHDSGKGFCFTPASGEALVARTCDLHDGAVPAGNSAAAALFLGLWTLTGDDGYREAAEGVFARFVPESLRNPYGAARLLDLAERSRRGLRLVAVSGEGNSADDLFRAACRAYDPCTRVVRPGLSPAGWAPPALQGKDLADGAAAAWVCEGTTCGLPARTPEELEERMQREIRR